MIDLLFTKQTVPLFFLAGFMIVFLIQLGYYWIIFFRLSRKRDPQPVEKPEGISVVLCAHNEFRHLRETLPAILEQDHPNFEVLVVNHSSDDDTHFLLTHLEERYPNLNTIRVAEDLNFFSGKKFPLSIGIKSAKFDTILLTDADCTPASPFWIRQMQAAYGPKTEIVLGYSPYQHEAGLLNRLIRFDTAHNAMQYLSYSLTGVPYMGVGRNLSYKREVFYRNQGFISHYRIRSGDDDLFINSVAKRSNTSVTIHPESFTRSDPKRSLGDWIIQKKRHLSTSRHYKFRHKFLLGLYSLTQLLFYGLFILMLALNWSVIPVAGIFLLRLVSQYIVFTRCLRKLGEKDLAVFIPFYEILLLLFNAGVLVSNMVKKSSRWK